MVSCSEKDIKGKFTVAGEIQNTNSKKIFLDELSFTGKEPVVIDTAEILNGKFKLEGIGPEEGIYRTRLEDGKQYIFINDAVKIDLLADTRDSAIIPVSIKTNANILLRNFMGWIANTDKEMSAISLELQKQQDANIKDSLSMGLQMQLVNKMTSNVQYIQRFADTVSSPVVAMFALGYLNTGGQNSSLNKTVANLRKRFPEHKALITLEQDLQRPPVNEQPVARAAMPGSQAPELTMNDVDDKPFSLSSLKGKYVLVDFWASWCAPCRDENPNVVNAFTRYKSKNFTVLGVSLDKEKQLWLDAIKADGLTWKHISDLKFWNSMAVQLYGLESIPSNVLLDPNGIIIAKDLRGPVLEKTLASVLK